MSKIDELRKLHEQALEADRKRDEAFQKKATEQQAAAAEAHAALVGLRPILAELLTRAEVVGAEVKAEVELLEFLRITPQMGVTVPLLGCIYRDRAVGFGLTRQRGGTPSTEAMTYKREQHGAWNRRKGKTDRQPSGPHPSALNSAEALATAFDQEFKYLLAGLS